MNGPGMDPQRMAALLENRLDARERAELIAQIAGSEGDFEVLAEAAATLAELRADEVPAEVAPVSAPGVIPLRPRAPAWRRPVVGVALAAGLAGAALVPWALSRGGTPGSAGEVAALLSAPEAGLPGRWNPSPWTATRTSGEAMSRDGRAARIGARMVDLEVAVRAGDAAGADTIAAAVERLLSPVTAGGAAARSVRIAAESAGRGRPEVYGPLLRRAHEDVLLAGERAVTRGAWAEAARLAAERRDADFFRASDSRRVLSGMAEDGSLRPAAREAAERIRTSLDGAALEWTSLQRGATDLFAALAR